MNEIAVIPSHIIEDIKNTQNIILNKLNQKDNVSLNEKYISRPNAAKMFDCDEQTIANFEKEGLISRYGRGRFIRYSIDELKKALGIIK
ncbi:hypothetical protein [Malaciobacter mytili]|uniref:hypothetical protein n=1 Tax=Malaciobacter mytili TaxID=603050 RepID=UPI003A86D60A